jgi:GH25 family lysozyme M1 (1,4-beta-N-acetylmuramidase)
LNVKPESKTGINLWQFTSFGQFSGYSGRLDTNYAYKDSFTCNQSQSQEPLKTIEEIAQEVLEGKWGNGDARKQKLIAAGYDYNKVQKKVNELLSKPKKKSVTEIAKEVIAGK